MTDILGSHYGPAIESAERIGMDRCRPPKSRSQINQFRYRVVLLDAEHSIDDCLLPLRFNDAIGQRVKLCNNPLFREWFRDGFADREEGVQTTTICKLHGHAGVALSAGSAFIKGGFVANKNPGDQHPHVIRRNPLW